jgi:hypothetical protein
MRIAVAGMFAGVPGQGGATWAALQYALGLRRLGHDVIVLEEVPPRAFEQAAVRLEALAGEFGFAGRAALIERGTGRIALADREALIDLLAGAELLLNLSGTVTDEPLLDAVGVRAFVDLDPGFTQLWHAVEGIDMGFDRHDRFVTIGHGIGSPGSAIPDCGRPWLTTPQPILLSHWPFAEVDASERLTSIGHWRAYGSIHHGGVHYGQRAHALRPLFELPERLPIPVELALGIDPGERTDIEALDAHGWGRVDPLAVASTPAAYAAFVSGSWAELGVAKLGYVASRCGWFSDRSVCYLASGRPVIAHDTGFGDWLAGSDGVFPFSSVDDVAAAVEALRSDYGRHRRAARELAETVFDSDRVLGELLACL